MTRHTDASPVEFGWTGALVRHRLLDAMRTLNRMPESRGPQGMKSSWPDDTYAKDPVAVQVEHWKGELYALELPKEEQEERRRDRQKAWSRTPPNAGQISRMEQALIWAGRHLEETDRRFLNLWAFYVGVENNSRQVQMMFGVSKQSVFKRSVRLCDRISDRLNADRVPVL